MGFHCWNWEIPHFSRVVLIEEIASLCLKALDSQALVLAHSATGPLDPLLDQRTAANDVDLAPVSCGESGER